jgi:hypothetical protein
MFAASFLVSLSTVDLGLQRSCGATFLDYLLAFCRYSEVYISIFYILNETTHGLRLTVNACRERRGIHPRFPTHCLMELCMNICLVGIWESS